MRGTKPQIAQIATFNDRHLFGFQHAVAEYLASEKLEGKRKQPS
jgi:hypothetical protein